MDMIVSVPEFFFFTCMRNLTLMSDRKTGYFPLNAEKSRGVIHGFIFTYAHEKLSILMSV